MTVIIERLARGGHSSDEIYGGEACLVEAASVEAGPPEGADDDWTPDDHDERVSPIIATYCRRLNDDLGDEDRQRLLPYKARIIGTRDDSKEEARRWLVTDWMVHKHLPLWLRAAGCEEQAAAVEALPTITSRNEWDAVRHVVVDARKPVEGAWMKWRSKIREVVGAELKRRSLTSQAAAADAAAAAAVVADAAAAAGEGWSKVYWAARHAIEDKLRAVVKERLDDTTTTSLQSGLDLLDALIAL